MLGGMITVRAIVPTRATINGDVQRLIDRQLRQTGFAGGMIRRMADYPEQQPPFGAAQSLGIRAGARTRKRSRVGRKPYRRTGTLGRGWRMRNARPGSIEVSNRVPYTVYVEGPPDGAPRGGRQTAVMRAKGWQNIRVESAAEWATHRPIIIEILTQRDPRLGTR